MPAAKNTKGRCLCQAIKYEFEGDAKFVEYCHCESCRRHTSSVVATVVGVKLDQFHYLEGTPASYQSSPGVWRYFCPSCGSPMAYTNDPVWPGEVHLYLGTLENPKDFKPNEHVHAAEQVAWFEIDDGLPRYEGENMGKAPARHGPKRRA
jgi:hypothetical protein